MSWETRLVKDARGRIDKRSGANVTLVLENHPDWAGCFGYDHWRGNVFVRSCPVQSVDTTDIFLPLWTWSTAKTTADWLEIHYGLKPSKDALDLTVKMLAWRNQFDSRRK